MFEQQPEYKPNFFRVARTFLRNINFSGRPVIRQWHDKIQLEGRVDNITFSCIVDPGKQLPRVVLTGLHADGGRGCGGGRGAEVVQKLIGVGKKLGLKALVVGQGSYQYWDNQPGFERYPDPYHTHINFFDDNQK